MSETQTTVNATGSGLNTIRLSLGHIEASADRSEHLVALRPACDQLGIDYARQFTKLKGKHWATVALKPTVAADGRTREMVMVTRDTFTMWLATIEPSRVNEAARPMLIAFQKEAVAALDAYFHEGGAINPRATEDQLDRLTRVANARMSLIERAKGIIQPDYLEAQARIVLAEGMGREPELDETTLPMDVESYLRQKGVSDNHRRALRGTFGKRVKAAYVAEFGVAPKQVWREINGTTKEVNGYTEQHRHLFDHVFAMMGIDQAELEIEAV